NHQIDDWLKAIQDVRTEFDQNPEGLFEASRYFDSKEDKPVLPNFPDFKPTQEQWDQYKTVKDLRIPILQDDILSHCVNLMMRDGKKEVARRNLAKALYLTKLTLKLDPIRVFKKTLISLAPLVTTTTFKDGTAKSVLLPIPLPEKKRRRIAFLWLLDGARKRPSRDFGIRLGEEIIAAYGGKSTGYQRRAEMHKVAIANRAYVKVK
ncbi:mitochondrial 37S ribosomal protein uS7m, partial [Ascoidea rubescens DSM 1968]